MRIERLALESFGHFRGQSLEFGPGVTLLCGPNEAGKSTLLGFIRSMLFGFEGRNNPLRYEPEGGSLAGEVWLATEFGRLKVRRTSGRKVVGDVTIRDQNGQTLAETKLADALAGVERELFFQVFAFSLDELSEFEKLSKETSIHEALLAAGMRGARRLPLATAALAKSTDELFTPRSRNKPLNQRFEELEQVQEQLRLLGDRPAELIELESRRRGLRAQLEALVVREREDSARLAVFERLVASAADVAAFGLLERDLAGTERLAAFPEELVARFEQLGERRQRAKTELANLEREHEQVVRSRPSGAALSPSQVEAIRTALERADARAALDEGLPARIARSDRREVELAAGLRGLGLGLEVARFEALELGGALRAELTDVRDRLVEARRLVRTRSDALATVEAGLGRARAEVAQLEVERAGLTEVPAQAIRREQQAAARIPSLRVSLEQAGREADEARRRADALESEPLVVAAHAFPLGFAVAVLVVIAAVVAGLIFTVPAALWPAVALGVAGLAAVAFAHLRATRTHRAQQSVASTQRQAREAEVARLRRVERDAAARAQAQREELERVTRELGLTGAASDSELEAWNDAASARLAEAELRARLGETLRSAAARASEAEAERSRVSDQLRGAEAALAEQEVALRAWLEARSFPATLSAEQALELWTQAQGLQRAMGEHRADAAVLTREREEAKAVCTALCEALSVVGVRVDEVSAARVKARELLSATARLEEELRRCDDRLAGLGSRLKAAKAELEELEVQRAAVLARAEVDSEEALIERAVRAREVRAKRAQMRELELRITAATGGTVEQARERISAEGGSATLEQKRAALASELGTAREQLRTLSQEDGAILERLKGLETDAEVASLRAREEGLKLEIIRLTERYVQDRLALGMLEHARARHERENQPRLLAEASAVFARITAGRYGRVIARAEGGLEVEDRSGKVRPAAELSRGTREQLYLSFRIALIRDFAGTKGPLPVIVDDILVNFDPERARATVAAFAELGQTHQVIAFSCQPHLREVFAEQGAAVLQIPPAERTLLQTA